MAPPPPPPAPRGGEPAGGLVGTETALGPPPPPPPPPWLRPWEMSRRNGVRETEARQPTKSYFRDSDNIGMKQETKQVVRLNDASAPLKGFDYRQLG